MLKSTLIAKCLYQNRMVSSISIGESAVKSIFEEYFPGMILINGIPNYRQQFQRVF
ncbi:hypothetical protein TUM1881_28790 [Escherichia coli]|nr:hypothetical protein TUM1881_28790 [Escherichia coli]BDY51260.1 hypothetical protein MUTS4_44240 [Escherichia coli]